LNPAQDYILSKSEPFRAILLELCATIEAQIPEVQLKYKWRIPAYYIDNKPFCYLNHSKNYIDLGFWHAAHITVHPDKLIAEKRAFIRTLRYRSLEEIEPKVLTEVLQDAYANRHKGFYK
jgi:hypothetical protein